MRRLVVVADDFGLGPATSDGILALADEGLVTTTVLLVNSPFAADGVARWTAAGRKLELGWHPCLTLDGPVLPARQVPSLVGPDGRFHALGGFLLRLARGRIHPGEVRAELAAQLARYGELVGEVPRVVNGHHHCHTFPVVRGILREVLGPPSALSSPLPLKGGGNRKGGRDAGCGARSSRRGRASASALGPSAPCSGTGAGNRCRSTPRPAGAGRTS